MIAEMTAKMHKMPLGTKTESRLWSYMRLLLGLCPDGPEAFAEAKRAAGKEVPDMDVLKRYGEFEVWLRLEMTRNQTWRIDLRWALPFSIMSKMSDFFERKFSFYDR